MKDCDKLDELYRIYEQAYRSVEMYSVMDNLDAGDRNIIMMRCNEEKSFKDIGDVLGISEAAARKRFERARKQLAVCMQSANHLLRERKYGVHIIIRLELQ